MNFWTNVTFFTDDIEFRDVLRVEACLGSTIRGWGQKYTIFSKDIKVHEGYTASTKMHDIALLNIYEGITFSGKYCGQENLYRSSKKKKKFLFTFIYQSLAVLKLYTNMLGVSVYHSARVHR